MEQLPLADFPSQVNLGESSSYQRLINFLTNHESLAPNEIQIVLSSVKSHITPHINALVHFTVSKVNIHATSELIDREGNGGLAGFTMKIIEKTGRKVDIYGIKSIELKQLYHIIDVNDKHFPSENNEKVDISVGIADNIGNIMTCKILIVTHHVLYRATVHPADDDICIYLVDPPKGEMPSCNPIAYVKSKGNDSFGATTFPLPTIDEENGEHKSISYHEYGNGEAWKLTQILKGWLKNFQGIKIILNISSYIVFYQSSEVMAFSWKHFDPGDIKDCVVTTTKNNLLNYCDHGDFKKSIVLTDNYNSQTVINKKIKVTFKTATEFAAEKTALEEEIVLDKSKCIHHWFTVDGEPNIGYLIKKTTGDSIDNGNKVFNDYEGRMKINLSKEMKVNYKSTKLKAVDTATEFSAATTSIEEMIDIITTNHFCGLNVYCSSNFQSKHEVLSWSTFDDIWISVEENNWYFNLKFLLFRIGLVSFVGRTVKGLKSNKQTKGSSKIPTSN